MDILKNSFINWGLNEQFSFVLSFILNIVGILVIALIINFVISKILQHIALKYLNNYTWGNAFLENKVFKRVSHIIPVIFLYLSASTFNKYSYIFQRIALVLLILSVVYLIDAILNSMTYIYTVRNSQKKFKPVKTYIQIIKIIMYIISSILVIATILDKSPALLLGGIGAASAILSLIFKDSILGFVASTQLSANDMVRIGDWIEIPNSDISGDVIDISLTTVKIVNFDKTISTIPAYDLVSNSFKNWRGMQSAGGRRIKRAILIDTNSVKFCDDEMIEKYKDILILSDYINSKLNDIKEYNSANNIESGDLINGRNLTNIGTFRAYITAYLANSPNIHKEMTQMVRQLEPTEKGIPIEVYAFTNTTNWKVYENIQGDLFDHLFAIAPYFELRIFQNPTGHDFVKSS